MGHPSRASKKDGPASSLGVAPSCRSTTTATAAGRIARWSASLPCGTTADSSARGRSAHDRVLRCHMHATAVCGAAGALTPRCSLSRRVPLLAPASCTTAPAREKLPTRASNSSSVVSTAAAWTRVTKNSGLERTRRRLPRRRSRSDRLELRCRARSAETSNRSIGARRLRSRGATGSDPTGTACLGNRQPLPRSRRSS